jgi:diguanylate cyclase (GGDEF)-like protein/PAS domain S-box-containing protein
MLISESKDKASLLMNIINSLAVPIFVKNKSHTWLLVNDAYCSFMGLSREDVEGKTDYEIFPKTQAEIYCQKDDEAFISNQVVTNIYTIYDSNNFQHTIETKKFAYHDAELGKIICGIDTDITELTDKQNELDLINQNLSNIVHSKTKELETLNKKLLNIAYRDSLTGLQNRVSLYLTAKEYIDNYLIDEEPFALIYIDMDDFKFINYSYGHAVGDSLLVTISKRLNGLLFNMDMCDLARVGGDEFMILLKYSYRNEIKELLDKIVLNLKKPINVGDYILNTSASIGIAVCPDHGVDVAKLARNSDTAMYIAKNKYKGSYQFYLKEFTKLTRRKLEIEGELRTAINNREIEVYFQPIVLSSKDVIVGYEALARWNSKAYGEIPPTEFIKIAEDSGLIIPLGKQVFEQVMVMINNCKNEEYISINVSPIQLKQANFQNYLESLITESNINPKQLVIEITESVMMQQNATIKQLHSSLVLKGIQFFVDDFGTGYSNLAQLKKLQFDAIKIDREFIKDLTTSEIDRSLVKVMIMMAKELKLKVVAEGVETEQQKKLLNSLNCDYLQGFLLGRPLPRK